VPNSTTPTRTRSNQTSPRLRGLVGDPTMSGRARPVEFGHNCAHASALGLYWQQCGMVVVVVYNPAPHGSLSRHAIVLNKQLFRPKSVMFSARSGTGAIHENIAAILYSTTACTNCYLCMSDSFVSMQTWVRESAGDRTGGLQKTAGGTAADHNRSHESKFLV